MMYRIIGVSGTPGVGKTAVAKRLSEILGGIHVDLSKEVIEKGLYVEFDAERESYVIDEDRVRNYIEELYRQTGKTLIVDSHYAEVAPRELVDYVFVLRLNPAVLMQRLASRGWSCRKVAENVEAELLSVCTRNAVEELGEDKVVEIDVTHRNVQDVVNEIINVLKNPESAKRGHVYDWFSLMSGDELEKVLELIEMCR